MLTIAWDVDDVLNDLMYLWFEYQWLPGHPECALKYRDIIKNPPHRLLGVSINDYEDSLDTFRLSNLFQEMEPVPEVKNWFTEYGHLARHIALTAVPLCAASVSASWVFKHFGVWIRTFHFVPSKRKGQDIPEYDASKGSFFRWLGKVDILIDDNELNIKDAEDAGVKGILMPRYWNSNKSNIKDTLEHLTELIKS